MEKSKKVLWFYVLGNILPLAIINVNYSILKDFFWRFSWRCVCKNTVLRGSPIGAAFWMLLTYKFPTCTMNFKFIVAQLTPYFIIYLIGVLIVLNLKVGTQLNQYSFVANNYYSNNYNIFGFSVLLGISLAMIFLSLNN